MDILNFLFIIFRLWKVEHTCIDPYPVATCVNDQIELIVDIVIGRRPNAHGKRVDGGGVEVEGVELLCIEFTIWILWMCKVTHELSWCRHHV